MVIDYFQVDGVDVTITEDLSSCRPVYGYTLSDAMGPFLSRTGMRSQYSADLASRISCEMYRAMIEEMFWQLEALLRKN